MAANNRFRELSENIMALEDDFDKFYNKNNKTAGTRVRQAMQSLKVMAQEIRTEIQDIKSKM